MRLICLSVAALIAMLGACSDRAVDASARFGCQPVEGVSQLSNPKVARYVLVGEFTETNEAPAAFAEIACHAAANLKSGEKLFVGVLEYLGGATDAESRMRKRLDDLTAKGAPIIVGVVGEQGREWTPRARDLSETHWAEAIEAKVSASGASRALILLTRADASIEPVKGGDRYANYDPMAMHLPEGQVMSLEITRTATFGDAPAIRIYPARTGGFSGEVAFAKLTRPAVAIAMPDSHPEQAKLRLAISSRVLKPGMSRVEARRAVIDDLLGRETVQWEAAQRRRVTAGKGNVASVFTSATPRPTRERVESEVDAALKASEPDATP